MRDHSHEVICQVTPSVRICAHERVTGLWEAYRYDVYAAPTASEFCVFTAHNKPAATQMVKAIYDLPANVYVL